MSRYLVLSDRGGLQTIEADFVDESDPIAIRFISPAQVTSCDRRDLLWWRDSEASPPAPFANLSPSVRVPVIPAGMSWNALETFGGPPAAENRSRISAAAMKALVDIARQAVPDGWRHAVLEMKVRFEMLPGRYRVAHRLCNPDTEEEAVDFSDALFAAIEVFHWIEVESGQNWNRCLLTLRLHGSGRCDAELSRENGRNFGPR